MAHYDVIVACEYSGAVRDAFRRLGFNAISCDLLPTDVPGPHHTGDAVAFLRENTCDLLVAHPPCTRLTNSGVRWLHERNLWAELDTATDLFRAFLECSTAHYVAVENPIPHRYAVERIGAKYSQVIQPWQFGHGESKATCLWLRGLPALTPTDVVEGREQRVWKLPPTADRWKLRSTTFQGIADAMAAQWGAFLRADRAERETQGLPLFTNTQSA